MSIDPFAPDAIEDPYPLYARMQDEAPVYQIPETGLWMVTRHADVVEAAGAPEIFSSHISAVVYRGEGPNPVVIEADPDAIGAVDVLATQDPPIHTAQRKLVSRAFSHARITALEPDIGALVARMLDDAGAAFDWMATVANPLPVVVISRLLGLPPSDGEDLRRWADAGVELLSGVAPAERLGVCWEEMVAFLAYLRARLADPVPGGVIADVADAVARGDLSEREGVSLMLQLVIAGAESTASLMGSAVRLLAQDARLQDEMRAHPERLGVFLEEALRLESPFRGHFRITTRETVLGGVTIPAGARVALMWGAGNRDADAYPDADVCVMERAHPKQHLAFGSGIHFCIGAPLARMEARIAITTLLARASSFTVDGPLRHVPSLFVRRLEALPLCTTTPKAIKRARTGRAGP